MKYLIKVTNKYNNTEGYLSNVKSIKGILKELTLLEGDKIEVFSKNNISDLYDIQVNSFKFLEEKRNLISYKNIVVSRIYLFQNKENKLEAYILEFGTNKIVKYNSKEKNVLYKNTSNML